MILDLALPGADGFEIARRLRALPELDGKTTYISLSGFGQPHDFRKSQDAGFERHLVKPVNPGELRSILDRLLQPGGDSHG